MLTASQLHTRAKAANTAGRPHQSRTLLLRALERDPEPGLRSLIEGTLGFVESELGDPRRGLELLTSALSRRDQLEASQVGVILAQRALVRRMLDQPWDALADFEAATPLLADLPAELGRIVMNRGHLHLQLAQPRAAAAHLAQAVTQFTLAAMPVQEAMARHNQGYAALLSGDLVTALRLMDGAFTVLANHSEATRAICEQDRAEALLAAGLVDDGLALLASAATLLGRRRLRRKQAEAEFAFARTAAAHDLEAAAEAARRAARRFRTMDTDAWARRADAIALSCDMLSGAPPRQIDELAESLRLAGHTMDADFLRLAQTRAALAAGQSVSPLPVSSQNALPLRLAALDTNAAIAIAEGDTQWAFRLIRRGIREVHSWQARFASLDLQTSLAVLGQQLADRGLALALADGRPALVYEWIERTGAMSGRIEPVRPPTDEHVAADLSELRALAVSQPSPDSSEGKRQGALERRIRERAWLDEGSARLTRLAPLTELRAALAATDACLFAPTSSGDGTWGLVIGPRRSHVVRLGEPGAIRAELAGLAADLDLAAADLSPAMATAVVGGLRERLERLDGLITGPVASLLTARRVVVNPTGLFAGVPWALLPTLAGRPVTIPRSASAWLTARERPHEYALAGFAAGPRLERAEREVVAAAAAWPRAEVITGAAAHAAAVSELAGRVDLLHLAAHGHHVVDNPLFSTLDLVDGPWYGYDLDQLPDVPETVILSACELGATTLRRGDEMLGLTTAWLHAGARCVIASPVSVSDDVAAAILPDVHAALAAGVPPADALAAATAAHPERVSTFQCYGAGW